MTWDVTQSSGKKLIRGPWVKLILSSYYLQDQAFIFTLKNGHTYCNMCVHSSSSVPLAFMFHPTEQTCWTEQTTDWWFCHSQANECVYSQKFNTNQHTNYKISCIQVENLFLWWCKKKSSWSLQKWKRFILRGAWMCLTNLMESFKSLKGGGGH